METKNNIIVNYARTIAEASNSLLIVADFKEDDTENKAIVKTLNVELEALRSHIVLMQQALDAY